MENQETFSFDNETIENGETSVALYNSTDATVIQMDDNPSDNSTSDTPIYDGALDYMEVLTHMSETLDKIYETVSANSVSDNYIVVTVSQNEPKCDSVSDNTVSCNTVKNPLITTKLEDYSLTDSLLLVLCYVVVCGVLVGIFFDKK